MGSAQQFSLRWNNYSQHIVTALDDLRSEDELTDVTLSCEGQKIKAHKILLSACSTYFRETFRENPCKHPVIILKGVSLVDLQAVVTFMYNGQVNVTQERLPSFLQTAELLQIKGLTDMNDKSEREEGPASTSTSSKLRRVVNQNNLNNANSDLRSQTPETVQRPPTPKRRKVIPNSFQNQHSEQSTSLGGNAYNSPNAIAGPSSSMNAGGSSGGVSGLLGPSAGDGLINPAVLMAQSDSNSAEDYPHPSMLKFEEEDVLDDDEEFRNNLSEEGDNSMQDLGNIDQGAIEYAEVCNVAPMSLDLEDAVPEMGYCRRMRKYGECGGVFQRKIRKMYKTNQDGSKIRRSYVGYRCMRSDCRTWRSAKHFQNPSSDPLL